MRPQIGQEKIWLPCFLLFPWEVFFLSRNKRHTREPQPQAGADALTSLAGQGGRAEGWIRLCRAQSPLPLPLFELLVAVLTAEAPAFPGPVPHVSAAAGIAVAQPLCCRQRGLLRHICHGEEEQ